MAVPQQKFATLPHAQERRRHQRVRINLLGRYMLEDRREFPCQVVNMSPGGMALIAPVSGEVGARVIAYVDHLGRLEGKIARHLAERLRHDDLGDAAQARQARSPAYLARQPPSSICLKIAATAVSCRQIVAARLIMPNGTNVGIRIIDLSLSGAGIATPNRPEVGTHVTLGKIPGRVVRHLEEGFAMEFTRLQHPDFIEENATAQ